MKIVSVILARGGSKGIPGKNIIDLNGKPLLYYSIQASVDSNVSKTFVSTDDDEISNVALDYGISVIDRPDELATDTAQSEDALLHFAEIIDFDKLVFIQPTSPLLKSSDINKGIEMLDSYDSIFSGYKEEWTSKWSNDMKPINWDGKNRPRRQDAEDVYVENGAFYITSKDRLLKSGYRYSGKIGCVEMPFNRSFQIDTLEDLELVEKII